MRSNYLFPTVCKKIGWALFIPFAIIGIIFLADSSLLPEIKWNPIVLYTGSQLTDHGQVPGEFFKTINDDMIEEIIVWGLAIALSLIAFSRERDEDELVEHLRAKSLVWSLKANVVCLLLPHLYYIPTTTLLLHGYTCSACSCCLSSSLR